MNHLNGSGGLDGSGGGEGVRELLAGRVLGDLSREELTALGGSASSEAWREESALEATAGALFLAMAGGSGGGAGSAREAVPGDVMSRLYRLADAYVAARSEAPVAAPVARVGQGRGASRAGWVRWSGPALAASVVLAAAGWYMALRPSAGASTPHAWDVRQAVLASADAVTLEWGEWSDESVTAEVKGVVGDVVWSDAAQAGVMRFSGLPDLPDAVYQLWIIDAERGMSQRVSGAIFEGGKDAVVRIEPRLRINRAAAFAVTIESPGGTWVSDMVRRVVIAARPG